MALSLASISDGYCDAVSLLGMLSQQATHPAAIALQDNIVTYKIPSALLYDYLDGIKLTRQLNHCCSEEDFNAYSYRTQGIKQTIAAYIYGFRDANVLHYARAMGATLTLMDEILYIGRNLKQERYFSSIITSNGVDRLSCIIQWIHQFKFGSKSDVDGFALKCTHYTSTYESRHYELAKQASELIADLWTVLLDCFASSQ